MNRSHHLESLIVARETITDTRDERYWIARFLGPHLSRALSLDVGSLQLVGDFPDTFTLGPILAEPQWTPYCFVEQLPNTAKWEIVNGEREDPHPRQDVLITRLFGSPAAVSFQSDRLSGLITLFMPAETGANCVSFMIGDVARALSAALVTRFDETGGALVDPDGVDWKALSSKAFHGDNPFHTQGVQDGITAMWAMSLVNSRGVVCVEGKEPRAIRRRLCRLLPHYETRRIRLEPSPVVMKSAREPLRGFFGGIEVRYHFRRGNWAHFTDMKVPTKSGLRSIGPRTVWRPPTMAGNPSKGYIDRSYILEDGE